MFARVIFFTTLIGILTISVLFAFSFVKAEVKILPGVKVGELNLSGLSYDQALSALNKAKNRAIYLNLPYQSYTLDYADLGVVFDSSVLKNYTQKCYFSIYCFQEAKASEDSLKDLVKIDQEKFKELVRGIDKGLEPVSSAPQASFEEGYVYAQDPKAKVVVDTSHLAAQLTVEKIFSQSGLVVQLKTATYVDKEVQRQATEDLAKGLSNDSLLVKYGREPVTAKKEQVAAFLTVMQKEDTWVVSVSADKVTEFLKDITSRYASLPVELEEKAAVRAIQYALLFRATGEQVNRPIILPLKGGPSTDGSLAKKYLEVNKSKQRMYRFEDGKLIKTYIVSTGLTWETPTGTFKIRAKQGLSISYFNNWWMPYYMPVGKVNGDYNFGFHEIPYQLGPNGQIKSRDPMTMGSPATGGCIQLDFGDAKEIYDWADIGMPVVIHD
ncbi:MAG: L,D-transpeptidase [Patescibacteria group bacterium]|nr:L,D-transpeptidase [Patescibacteria group bacterium]